MGQFGIHGAATAAPHSLLIGVDLGRVTTSLAVVAVRDDEARLLATRAERHLGDPLAPFLRLYRELGAEAIRGVVATGVHAEQLGDPVIAGLPEEVAQEQAAALLWPEHGPLNVVRLGGSGFSVLALDGSGSVAFERNDRCSAGAGESVERLCARLGRSLAEAVALAREADASTKVTARCAVFAKSELTHFANQGEPHGRLFRGQFESVAANVHGLYDKLKVEGPAMAIGHGALIEPIVEEFARLAGGDVTVPAEAGVFEAIGAAVYAVTAGDWTAVHWPSEPATLAQPPRSRVPALQPAGDGPGGVVVLREPATQEDDLGVAVLGLDLGSTGSKAALLDAGSLRVLAGVYRRTDGNPVEAASALVRELTSSHALPVVAIGLTGSGRAAAATVVRAAYPELDDRLCVQNEIVAHAAAAARYDPEEGRSLSIVEIGGQDAKFINVRHGRVVDADMNRVCSAGTGSFLEEQAEALGVADIAEFGALAARSRRPPDLGQTCTVFVADVAAEAMTQGYSRDDVFAGLQYSVVRNYRSRVMGQRRFLERVVFQGKPASNVSLARTLAACTGRTVLVPPDPGAMGAIGIGILVARQAVLDAATPPVDLGRFLEATVTRRREFRCRDRECGNLCRIESATVLVAGEERVVLSGGTCPKYDATGGVRKLPKGAPAPFRERDELLAGLFADDEDGEGPVVGIPFIHYLIDAAPFFSALFRGLGARVRLVRPGREALAVGDRRCAAPGACAAVKVAHGVSTEGLDFLFLPKFVNVPYPGAGCGASTCPMAQGSPEMIESALRTEGDPVCVLRPVLFMAGGAPWSSRALATELAEGVAALRGVRGGFKPRPFAAAFERAVEAQRAFEAGLAAIGERAFAAAEEFDVPAIVVAGETHVIHDALLNPGIHDLIAANGALPVPLDCVPVPDDLPPLARVHWATAGRVLRAVAAAARRLGMSFPLLMGAYGCGPNSFIEHLFNDLLEGYPHAVLETDGHGGTAGYVTRVQAFLHAVHGYRTDLKARGGADAVVPERRLERYDRPIPHSFASTGSGRVYFGNVGGSVGRQVAAAMRGGGIETVFVGPSDEEALRCGQAECSGKECLPYQLLWGSLVRFLESGGLAPGERAVLMSVGNGFRSCRANMFPLTQQIALERRGLGDRLAVADLSLLTDSLVLTPVVWAGLVANDLLLMVRFYNRATEARAGSCDELFAHWSDELEHTLEQRDGRPGGAAAAVARTLRRVERVVTAAAADFAALPRRPDAAAVRDVFLCGDIYLRVDEWGNDGLQHRLAELGLRPVIEPYSGFFELLALREVQERSALSSLGAKRRLTLAAMRRIAARLIAAVQAAQPWVFWNDIREVEAESRRIFDGFPFGETIPTVGGALLTTARDLVDGVVVVAPRGCGPALISEAQLRRRADFPLLFVYNDGDPVDQARLAGFAWRLRARAPRVGASPAPGGQR